MPAQILSIAYDPDLGETRRMLLKEAGYSVHSVVGNDAGMKAAERANFRMFIVGHDAPELQRMKMVHWLKKNHPKIPVLALQASAFCGKEFGEANCVASVEDPDEWLQAVAQCVK